MARDEAHGKEWLQTGRSCPPACCITPSPAATTDAPTTSLPSGEDLPPLRLAARSGGWQRFGTKWAIVFTISSQRGARENGPRYGPRSERVGRGRVRSTQVGHLAETGQKTALGGRVWPLVTWRTGRMMVRTLRGPTYPFRSPFRPKTRRPSAPIKAMIERQRYCRIDLLTRETAAATRRRRPGLPSIAGRANRRGWWRRSGGSRWSS